MKKIVLAFFVAVVISGCSGTKIGSNASADYDKNPLEVVVPVGVPSEVVHKAMLGTVVGRKWIVQSHSENEVVAILNHRGFDATVTLQSDDSIIKILNKSTYKDPQTGEIKPGVPLKWLINIQKDLQSKLATSQYQ